MCAITISASTSKPSPVVSNSAVEVKPVNLP
eukprot:CAMPEP_0183354976 /NCGR_PEP_ID=MMETSP0164_2-20130417/38702_1 /TAXON_ID=221442 /ORGANISM="Coccolithus pelagicus ssp braarudi, Strain PLY182g" /LENGTH=30 /DNA_ID= /DNA_START= /DNA_END= /DNA_ORIENTATION=